MSLSLLRLLTFLSPAFPVGAFAYSSGLETAVRDGRLGDAEAVCDWIGTLLRHGSLWNDLVLCAEAHRAALAGDGSRLAEVAELATALAGSAERRQEALALGAAFAEAARPWEDLQGVDVATAVLPYCVAVGAVTGRVDIPLHDALAAFAHAGAANLVGAATRLVPLGQSRAVAVLARLEPVLLDVAARAALSDLDDLGTAAFLSEIAALRHEALSPRIFRS
ncbi:urease accessory protein UreF [Aurantimonas sp. MSK8Z-1]|uniref:urease accessory protein UreF n=1 Tax=Mangrovibrevibacter kandeliae TaxID=2968473 RepID=UPI002118F8E8|nr:urease accessory UreF family protein [Aurantimonas sp. MSK8Z-1]MCW4115562.1 urease accessory protein UreF [Aurantimonas sp. MSK8Z-1]